MRQAVTALQVGAETRCVHFIPEMVPCEDCHLCCRPVSCERSLLSALQNLYPDGSSRAHLAPLKRKPHAVLLTGKWRLSANLLQLTHSWLARPVTAVLGAVGMYSIDCICLCRCCLRMFSIFSECKSAECLLSQALTTASIRLYLSYVCT